jgi:imidazolonepropionase-like amidohydrolase
MTQDHLKSFERLDCEADAQFIKKISAKPSKAPAASVIGCGNRSLMPGLIDSHGRMVLSEVALPRLETMPLILLTARAAVPLRNRLERGFPSARDRRRRLRTEGGRRHMAVARRPAERRGQSGARSGRAAGAGDVSRRQHEGRTLSQQPVALAR